MMKRMAHVPMRHPVPDLDRLTLQDLRGLVIEKPRDADETWITTAWPSRPTPPFRAFFRVMYNNDKPLGGMLHVMPSLDGNSARNFVYCVFLERHFASLKTFVGETGLTISRANHTRTGLWSMSRADYALMRLTFGNHTTESG